MDLIKVLIITAELTNTIMSELAAEILLQDLKKTTYSDQQILAALEVLRWQNEKVNIANIIKNIPDGRPSAEEAWNLLQAAKCESASLLWTEEIETAYGSCNHLINTDKVAARLAFKDCYERLCLEAKRMNKPTKWKVSFGTSPAERDAVILKGIEEGKLKAANYTHLLSDAHLAKIEIEGLKEAVKQLN